MTTKFSTKSKAVRSQREKSSALPSMTVTFLIGVISLVAGLFGILTTEKAISTLSLIAGIVILVIAAIEFIRMFKAERKPSEFAFSLMRAGTGILIAVLTIVNRDQNIAWPLILLSIYTLGRGILEILTALVFYKDKTEKFMWLVCGAAGCLLGIIALNSGGFTDQTTFFRIFSIYLAVYGITGLVSLVYRLKR